MKTGLYSDMKKLLSVTFPILVAQLSTMGINFINTTMAGHAGADDLAGVSVGTGIFFPFEGAAIGLLMAGTPIIAQLIGKNEKSSIPFRGAYRHIHSTCTEHAVFCRIFLFC